MKILNPNESRKLRALIAKALDTASTDAEKEGSAKAVCRLLADFGLGVDSESIDEEKTFRLALVLPSEIHEVDPLRDPLIDMLDSLFGRGFGAGYGQRPPPSPPASPPPEETWEERRYPQRGGIPYPSATPQYDARQRPVHSPFSPFGSKFGRRR